MLEVINKKLWPGGLQTNTHKKKGAYNNDRGPQSVWKCYEKKKQERVLIVLFFSAGYTNKV